MLVKPCRLHDASFIDSSQWPAPVESYAGVLVKVPLNDSRGLKAAVSGGREPYILIPEDGAGPDVVAYPFLFSFKSNASETVVSKRSNRSSIPLEPRECYRLDGGADPNRSCINSQRRVPKLLEQNVSRIAIEPGRAAPSRRLAATVEASDDLIHLHFGEDDPLFSAFELPRTINASGC
jgi:hypothetical protein